MAKAKTPSTGGDKPTENATSRASAAAAKPKPAPKTPEKKAAAAKPVAAKTPDTKGGAKTSAAAKTSKDAAVSATPADKPDTLSDKADTPSKAAAPGTTTKPDVPKSDTAKPAVTSEVKALAETSPTPKPDVKPADKKADAPKAMETPKEAPKPTEASKPSVTPTPSQTTPAKPERSKSVFWPMVLGGLVACGIGFAAAETGVLATLTGSSAITAPENTVADQAARIAALEDALGKMPAETDAPATDLAAMEEIKASVAALNARIDEIENRPAPAAAEAPEVDTSAFEAELAALTSSVETQRDEIQRLLENALSVEEATEQAARAATVQSAVARIVAALTTGQSFQSEIDDLKAGGVQDIPAALTESAETGVTTSANLQDRFPDISRAALAAARADAPAGAGGGFGNFLKNQLGARSVTPREGTDPDAILSRAEAALRDGRLSDAITEVETLPEGAKAPMADWLADAQARQAAQDAVQTLTQRLTAN
ncbi:COG4223 family protein [Roseobacter sp. GAI101]|uniref:COG4223 family protein n=1 Tax=Roseobacter sp. (strain GAI101) TaxID=391589 RepID=UPI00018718AB|nr:mitofilin family membrane protein [Roseobacter sp. GAI101]EEB86186.1 conserved hypothetical protein [Roseobacter sp. GAI101]